MILTSVLKIYSAREEGVEWNWLCDKQTRYIPLRGRTLESLNVRYKYFRVSL